MIRSQTTSSAYEPKVSAAKQEQDELRLQLLRMIVRKEEERKVERERSKS